MTRAALSLLVTMALVLASVSAAAQDADDSVLNLAEPDFTLISLPTSLRLPEGKSAFRVTHRFTRPLNCDTCVNSLAGDAFGLDDGAQIGLEYRMGVAPNTEVGVHRASDKTIELFSQYGLVRQDGRSPIEASALLAVDVSNVGQQQAPSRYSPVLGVVLTRLVGERAALYVEPIWVHHSNLIDAADSRTDTLMTGLGARIRVLDTVYVVGEFAPRLSGYDPGISHGSVALEKRVGGHLFQVNVSDSVATTLGQLARGGTQSLTADGAPHTDWYLGFNISRKFF